MNFKSRKLFGKLAMSVVALASCFIQMPEANAQQMQSLPQDPKLITGKLDNGLTYFIRHNEEPKDRADFYIAQRVGSMQEEDNQWGLAHFLEHMAFNGTKNFPGKNLINYLETIGVKFGENLNAYTSFDETVYTLMGVPTNAKGSIDSCLLILHDWSGFISLEEPEIDAERGVIREERRQRENGDYRVQVKMFEKAFPNNKYGKRMPIGSQEVIEGFKYQELRDYYHKWYRPDLQAIIVVGDVDAKEVEAKIKKMFADIKMPKNAAERVYFPVEINDAPIVASLTDKETTNEMVRITYKMEPLPREVKSTIGGLVQEYALSVITNMIDARFKEAANKPNAPIMMGGSYSGPYMSVAQTMDAYNFVALTKEGNYYKGLQFLTNEIERIKQHGFTKGEYSRASKDYMVGLKKLYDERDKQKNRFYTEAYVEYFNRGGNLASIETVYQAMQMLSAQIPLELINSAAKDIFKDKGITIFISGPEKDGLKYPSSEEILKKWSEFAKMPVEAYKDKLGDAKLMDKVPAKGKIVKEENGKFDSKIWTLANGAKVVIKKTNFKENEIRLSAYRPVGKFSILEKDMPNTKAFNDVINLGGLSKYNSEDLDKVLSGRIAHIEPSLDDKSTHISGSSTNDDLETMMQLLYLNFTAKRKDKEAFQAYKERTLAQIQMKKANPMSSIGDSISMALFGKNPIYSSLKEEELEKVNYDRVMSLYNDFFSGVNGFTFTIIGSFDEAKLKNYVETYIASLPKGKKNPYKQVELPTPRKGQYQNYYAKKMENPMAFVFNYISAKVPYNQFNIMEMQVLSDVLDQVYTASIREKEGGTYGVATAGRISRDMKDEASILIQFQTSPDKAKYLNSIAIRELKELAEKGTNKEQFNKVIENMKKKHSERLKENSYWMNTLNNYYYYNEDFLSSWEDNLNKLSPEGISKMAKKVLDQNNLITVILYTEGQELK